MTDNHKFFAGLFIGAAAGAAMALFLSSEKGKKMISSIKNEVNTMEDELHNTWEEIDTAMNDLLAKGKSFLEELEQQLSQSAS